MFVGMRPGAESAKETYTTGHASTLSAIPRARTRKRRAPTALTLDTAEAKAGLQFFIDLRQKVAVTPTEEQALARPARAVGHVCLRRLLSFAASRFCERGRFFLVFDWEIPGVVKYFMRLKAWRKMSVVQTIDKRSC